MTDETIETTVPVEGDETVLDVHPEAEIQDPAEFLGVVEAEPDGAEEDAAPVEPPGDTDPDPDPDVEEEESEPAESEEAAPSPEAEAMAPVLERMREAGLEGAGISDVVDAASAYVDAIAAMGRSAESAVQFIHELAEAVVSQYGESVRESIGAIDVSLLDPATMTDTERSLYGMLAVSRLRASETAKRLQAMTDENHTLIHRVERLETVPKIVQGVKASLDVDVTAAQIVAAIEKHGQEFSVQGGIRAVKLETLEDSEAAPRKASGGGDRSATPKATPPDRSPRVVDAKGKSVAELIELQKRGIAIK